MKKKIAALLAALTIAAGIVAIDTTPAHASSWPPRHCC